MFLPTCLWFPLSMAVAFLCMWNLQLRMKWPIIREFLCSLYCCLWEINFSFIPWEINKWSALSMAFLKDFFSFKVVVEQHTGNSIKSCSHSPCCSRVPSRALPEKKKKRKIKDISWEYRWKLKSWEPHILIGMKQSWEERMLKDPA